jgi:hypothetical protein
MNFSFAGSIAKVGALVWCPTNFQQARLNFYVDDHCIKLARLLGLFVTLYNYAAGQRAANGEIQISTLGCIGFAPTLLVPHSTSRPDCMVASGV